MKLKTKYVSSIPILFLLMYSVSVSAWAGDGEKARTVNAEMYLTAHFITVPDIQPLTAEGEGALRYELSGKTAEIAGESLPRLVYESHNPPGELSALTVIVEGMPGTRAVVDWEHFPEVMLDDVDVRVRAYDMPLRVIASDDQPIVDIILSKLQLTTGQVEVEGVESEGALDADRMQVLLVGKAVLPEYDYPLYEEWLAGQPVLLELAVKIKNPYRKS